MSPMTKPAKLDAAKQAFLEATADCDWVKGVGISLVDDKPGLTISVGAGKTDTAHNLLKMLKLTVPTKVRELPEVSARRTVKSFNVDDPNAMQALRDMAAKRLNDLEKKPE